MAAELSHYHFPSRVFFERGGISKIGEAAAQIGSRSMLITVRREMHNRSALETARVSLDKNAKGCIVYDDFATRPGFDELDTASHFLRQAKSDIIVAMGSRETFQAARAVALLATNEIFASDLRGARFPLKNPPLPIINVPILPAMGEEVSPVVSIYDEKTESMVQFIDRRLFPALVFIDPALTATSAEGDVARAGTAVMAATIESILSKDSNEITSTIALRALSLIASNLLIYSKDSTNMTARNQISMASLLCGMAYSSSMLGLCYSAASALSYHSNMDFFVAMAIMLPHVMDFNLTVSAARYIHIARSLDEDIKDITVIEAAIKAVEGVRKIYSELHIPQRLSDYEIKKSDLAEIAEMTLRSPMNQFSMRDLIRNEVETILLSAY